VKQVSASGPGLTTGPRLEPGDTFTIAGHGRGAKGQTVINGRNVKTNRKCKVVELTVFKVAAVAGKRKARVKPAIQSEDA
jgi:hypothetical protein